MGFFSNQLDLMFDIWKDVSGNVCYCVKSVDRDWKVLSSTNVQYKSCKIDNKIVQMTAFGFLAFFPNSISISTYLRVLRKCQPISATEITLEELQKVKTGLHCLHQTSTIYSGRAKNGHLRKKIAHIDCTQRAIKIMEDAKSPGVVINLSSASGGVVMFIGSLSTYNGKGICVDVLCPEGDKSSVSSFFNGLQVDEKLW
ncbi:unnamed protein product [Lactuca virosa]|uniref:Uncharacterized protein n=1 Tax=Lactuca virosa TaxID=75947 RepID=A0AAU9LFS6_9ASTR|nr:unnamed protein product [Lactuca virosa]